MATSKLDEDQDLFGGMMIEGQDDLDQGSDDEEPYTTEHMKQLLCNEKMAPEILPY